MSEERKPWDHAHETRQCVLTDLAEITGELPEGFLDAANSYLEPFAAPVWRERNDRKVMVCLHCGDDLTGLMASLFGSGGFEWGLVHGEGHCRGCGWPARALHYAKDAKGEDLFSLRNMVLQYRPDVEREEAARAAAA